MNKILTFLAYLVLLVVLYVVTKDLSIGTHFLVLLLVIIAIFLPNPFKKKK